MTALPEMAAPFFDDDAVDQGAGKPRGLGARKPFYTLPKDFKAIGAPKELGELFNADSCFSGVFERDGNRIRLLRIPSYSAKSVMTLPLGINFYMGLLNKHTDELIIDQMDNQGGMLQFSDLMLQSLVGDLDP